MRNKPIWKREPSFSACSLCHWRWLGPDLFYEMAFLWASTGEIPCFQIQPLLKWHATTKRHDFSPAYLASGVLQVSVPDQWIDSLFPEVRRVLEVVQTRNTRLQSGKHMTGPLTGQPRASCRLFSTVAFAFGRTCHSELRGESCLKATNCCSAQIDSHICLYIFENWTSRQRR